MSLALNEGNWWECSDDELWAINLRRSNFTVHGDKCDRHDGNQALINEHRLHYFLTCFSGCSLLVISTCFTWKTREGKLLGDTWKFWLCRNKFANFSFFWKGGGWGGGVGVGVDIRKRQKPQKIEQSKTVTDIRKPWVKRDPSQNCQHSYWRQKQNSKIDVSFLETWRTSFKEWTQLSE